MTLIDIQKGFYTLDHKILMEKIIFFGFKIPVLKRFESYLSNIIFFVSVADIFSDVGI